MTIHFPLAAWESLLDEDIFTAACGILVDCLISLRILLCSFYYILKHEFLYIIKVTITVGRTPCWRVWRKLEIVSPEQCSEYCVP